MNMLEIPVKLIVKTPFQQVEDQTIHCNLSWTIKRLKGYLSEVYPNKPNTEDQRLIYYGQVLKDSLTLKDVFTRYEAGEETHTVHLVCMPSKESLKMQARKMAEENSKKVKEAGGSGPSTSQRLPPTEPQVRENEGSESSQLPGGSYFQTGNQPWMTGLQSQPSGGPNNYIQQWAWMQQAYANYYMSQYMDMMARQNDVTFRGGYVAGQREAPHNRPPQPVQDANDDDNRLNRDWLDFFYIMSRLMILLSFVYFYSSPSRFLLVSSFAIILYLYHMGAFRMFQGVENNEMANNNIPAAADNNNVIPPRETPEGQRQEESGPQAQNQEQPVPDHPSFMAVTWTFVSTFFTSIIP